MNEPFSIVIPVYNRVGVVKRTLQSVLDQTYRPLHIILVDNNSTDGSLALLHEWADAHTSSEFNVRVCRQETPGAAAARNKGLSLVDTEFMLFFDSDDVLRPNAVETYMKVFTGHNAPDIVMSRARTTDTVTGKSHILPLRPGDRYKAHIHHGTLRTQGYAARTEIFRRAGGWNESTFIWDDWELGIRLLLATDKIVQIPDVVCEIFTGGESITGFRYSDRAELYEAPLQAAEKTLAAHPDLAALMHYRRMMLAAHFAREGAKCDARKLRNEVRLNIRNYPLRRKLLLSLAYHYIRLGGRGFDRIISLLY